ncbi:NAD-dependent epimerase/dehydratase family protein [Hymenobacter algoricola]|uniref:NAD(P)H-binding protein n=1 Tax=Hymenobacter algoricola TaxID=486267 RepID=A0ABP7NV47_9BACT
MTTNSLPRILVLGGTGSIGQAVAQNLLAKGYRVTLLARTPAKAQALFASSANLTIEPGDAEDLPRLLAVSRGHDVIFHGINYPYHQWEGTQERMTQNVIAAASQERALIIFPGNIYNFGLTTPIREDSAPAPITKKGAIRVRQEQLLAEAARAGRCRVPNVRLPDFWGPTVVNDGTIPIFEGALTGKALPWIATVDLPHQFVYTPDAAEIISRLLAAGQPEAYEVVNYGGQTVPSVRAFFTRISQIAGHPTVRVRVLPRWLFAVLAPFLPMMKAMHEMLYLYDHSILLDDTGLRRRFPAWRETPLDTAIATTLQWFARHRLNQNFVPAVPVTPPAFETHPASVPSIF